MLKAKLFILTTGLLVFLPALTRAASLKGIEGSPHDFTYTDWNLTLGVCGPCHQAHNTSPNQVAPLWAHATTTASFTPYDSPTFNAGRRQPSGVSLACLSCHDGTLAINQLIYRIEGDYPDSISGNDRIGPDLHASHPVSFVYDATLAAADGSLENPIAYHIGDAKAGLTLTQPPVPSAGWTGSSLTGKTIDDALLFEHKLECASCHDVHKQAGSAPGNRQLLRLTGTDGTGRDDLLCRTCHVK